jgi:UDP-N-acetylmuramoylalanine--D-glutamate ligase
MTDNGFFGESLKGMKVAIVGLARSGVSAARALHSLGADVFISDVKSRDEIEDRLSQLGDFPVEIESGGHSEAVFRGRDLVVVSPGVPCGLPLLEKAREHGVPVIGELELAFRLSRSPFIAVTGTNGKSTTTSLIHHILTTGGKRAVLGGNIGLPIVGEVMDIEPGGWVVTEVSSFQLETIQSFRPSISVILNITSDHLDRHGDFAEYAATKARIFMNQKNGDLAVFNADDPAVMSLRPRLRTSLKVFSRRKEVSDGAYFLDGWLILADKGVKTRLCLWNELPMRGFHNLENALAAVAVCSICGVAPPEMVSAMKSYRTMEHRLEFAGNIKGVKFYDDSKGTNPGAVRAALESFSEPVILIAGGKDKEMDFKELGMTIRRCARALIAIGESAEKISRSARDAGMDKIIGAETLEEAVGIAYRLAMPGDVVLLSPACASFDMFRCAEERGELFQRAVKSLMDQEEVS